MKIKKEPYATFEFTTIDSNTTDQTEVTFYNNCKLLLNKPKWWVVTIVFTMESEHLVSEHTLVFRSTEKTTMKEFNPCINYVLENHCLLSGFQFVKGRASCVPKDHKPETINVPEEINYELALYEAFTNLQETP